MSTLDEGVFEVVYTTAKLWVEAATAHAQPTRISSCQGSSSTRDCPKSEEPFRISETTSEAAKALMTGRNMTA